MPPRINPLKILLADDNDANRLIARTILERSSHIVTTANDGSHALRLAKNASYDLIILDIMMPVMDGMRAMRQLRRDKIVNDDTPIFALTAYCSAEDKQRYFMAGFDTVLSKPLRPGDVEEAILRYKDKSVPTSAPSTEVKHHGQVSSPLLDEEMISQLLELGDPDRLMLIQSRFWNSVTEKCLVMKKSFPNAVRGETSDLSEFRKAVHAIKGASAAIGLGRVAQISSRLQNAPPSDIQALMRDWTKAMIASRPVLIQALSGTRQLDTSVQMRGQDQAEAAHNR